MLMNSGSIQSEIGTQNVKIFLHFFSFTSKIM